MIEYSLETRLRCITWVRKVLGAGLQPEPTIQIQVYSPNQQDIKYKSSN